MHSRFDVAYHQCFYKPLCLSICPGRITDSLLFNSKFRNTDFNGRYATSALFGKEFNLSKKSMLSLGANITAVGGRWFGPADIAASNQAREVIVIDSLRNTQQFPDYFRCSTSYKTTYEAQQEEECDENFR